MAKKSTTVAVPKYHCLDGVTNDILRCLESEDWSAAERFYDAIARLDAEMECDETDDAVDTPHGHSGDMASELASGGPQTAEALGGPLARSSGDRTPASLLDGLLDYVPGHLRAQAIAELDQLRSDALGAPAPGLKKRLVGCAKA